MPTYSERWEAAKTKFENSTGVKKPKPKGFFKSFFNHTGLTTSISEMDASLDALEKGKMDEKPKLTAKAEEKLGKMKKAINDYLKVLDKDAAAEQADKNEKTELYRFLKVLSSELRAIDAQATNQVESRKITLQGGSMQEQADKMMKTALAGACAFAVAAVKKVQADPTPATFNQLFRVQDSPGRKVQVQLVSAANQLKAGKIKAVDVDPRFIADKLTPWQGATSPNNSMADTATRDQVLKRIDEFKEILKLALRYSEQL